MGWSFIVDVVASRLVWVLLPLSGCLFPFVHSSREKRQPPEAVQRFAAKAQALARPPGAPSLSEVTYSMSAAIEALPEVKAGDKLAIEVSKQAGAMMERPTETDRLARDSLDKALEAVRRAKPSVSQGDKDKVVEVARQAVQKVDPGQRASINTAYAEVARAMVVVTGGRAEAAKGSELSQWVERFAVEDPDDASRTGAQVILAMADALPRLPHPPVHADHIAKALRKRAQQLAAATQLDYAAQLKDSLSLVVRSFDDAVAPPAQRRLLDEAKAAVEAIRADRPLALQHAAMAEALQLVSEAISAR